VLLDVDGHVLRRAGEEASASWPTPFKTDGPNHRRLCSKPSQHIEHTSSNDDAP
jgi:hypothetical protein